MAREVVVVVQRRRSARRLLALELSFHRISCLASEVFGAMDCDCADQLRESMKRIAHEGRGLIIHMHQAGRGHGLSAKIQAVHAMQHSGLDTVEAFDALGLEQDTRSYRKAVDLLRVLDIAAVRLISKARPAPRRCRPPPGIRQGAHQTWVR